MRSDRVLIDHPEQSLLVADYQVVDRTVLLGNVDGFEPVWSFRYVFLYEPFGVYAVGKAFEGYGSSADLWQYERRYALVVVGDLAFCDTIGGEEELVGVGYGASHALRELSGSLLEWKCVRVSRTV